MTRDVSSRHDVTASLTVWVSNEDKRCGFPFSPTVNQRGGKWETAATIEPRLPIILCARLTYTGLCCFSIRGLKLSVDPALDDRLTAVSAVPSAAFRGAFENGNCLLASNVTSSASEGCRTSSRAKKCWTPQVARENWVARFVKRSSEFEICRVDAFWLLCEGDGDSTQTLSDYN